MGGVDGRPGVPPAPCPVQASTPPRGDVTTRRQRATTGSVQGKVAGVGFANSRSSTAQVSRPLYGIHVYQLYIWMAHSTVYIYIYISYMSRWPTLQYISYISGWHTLYISYISRWPTLQYQLHYLDGPLCSIHIYIYISVTYCRVCNQDI